MNEFIEQFLIECRELVEQATDDLLALEEDAGAQERLDGAFRAFHTLKGAAGIVEFEPMGRALHAAEDLLSEARTGKLAVTPALIGDALVCLDQVVQWLDQLEATGAVPEGADQQADALLLRLGGAAARAVAPAPDVDWIPALTARHRGAADQARTALRWRPDPDSFFDGLDPIAVLEAAPGLLVLEAAPIQPWPPLGQMDPFRCQVEFLALLSETPEAVRAAIGDQAGQAEVHGLDGPDETALDEAVLRFQLQMLATPALTGEEGRRLSAGRVAANVLRQRGDVAAADSIERLAAAGDGEGLAAAILRAVEGEPRTRESEAEAQSLTAAEPAMRALRVDVERIDALVNLTGELTVAKNALAHASALAQSGGDPRALAELLKRQHDQLDRLVGELQRSVLSIRVLPVRHAFQRFPRLVREMVVSLGKPIQLVTEGEATEADKTIVEALFEPLLHVIRNSVDHGVESPADRAAAGKPLSATLVLRARRDGDHVVIEVEDDGRGIDTDRVRAVALARGVASEEALAAMNEDEVAELIFAPGFSTAAEVTNLSGRGVGMDAVRAAVSRLGGRASVASRPGQGTTVRFQLPFSVVMSRIMTVEAGGQVFGIPLEAVVETVKAQRDAIQRIGAARAFVLRDRTIPLVDLCQVLGVAETPDDGAEVSVVVVTAGGAIGGLRVDRLGERLDVMLKPLDGLLAGAAAIAGTTLMGDGRVLLVLDVAELLQ